MRIHVELACLLALAGSPAILLNAFSSDHPAAVDVLSAGGACPCPNARMHAQMLWIPRSSRRHSSPHAVSGCITIQASDRVWFSDCVCKCDCTCKTSGALDIATLPWRLSLRHRSHRLWRVQDLMMLARSPLLPFAVLSSRARGGHKRNLV